MDEKNGEDNLQIYLEEQKGLGKVRSPKLEQKVTGREKSAVFSLNCSSGKSAEKSVEES